jgi:hypothetical protein
MKTSHKPREVLREICKSFPDVWKKVKMFREIKGKDLPDWPDWCYIPIAAGVAIATKGNNLLIYKSNFENINPAVITAAAAWKVSQGIYRFDADLYNSLINQGLEGNVPCDVLKRLPEYCVYIETINAKYLGKNIEGFWVHLEKDMNDGQEELRFVFFCEDGTLIKMPLHIGNWTIEECINKMINYSLKNIPAKDMPDISGHISNEIIPFIQLVLYLCAENVDLINKPKHPSTRMRTFGGIDSPKEPKVWNVGERIGTTIRKHRNESNQESESRSSGSHSSPRPHIRKAHWHHFWSGKGRKELILKWLPPIPVGIDDNEEDGPIVIHKVK